MSRADDDAPGEGEAVSTQDGPRFGEVARAVGRCALTTAGMLAHQQLSLPRDRVGAEFHFADGTTSAVFRETAARRRPPTDPVVLVVRFRLRMVANRTLPQEVFRRTCIVNTPLFAGFPGFYTKLWLTDTATGTYRGVYEWQGAAAAEHYARVLSRVLALVSVRGSISYRVLPALRRAEYLRASARDERMPVTDGDGWWRLTKAVGAGRR